MFSRGPWLPTFDWAGDGSRLPRQAAETSHAQGSFPRGVVHRRGGVQALRRLARARERERERAIKSLIELLSDFLRKLLAPLLWAAEKHPPYT